LELVWKRKDGSPLIVRSNGKVVRDNEGEITSFEVFVEDITERKRTEYALKNSEERFRTIFENSPIGIYQCTISGTLISANNAMVKILGYDTPEELLERNLPNDIYYNREDSERIRKELAKNGSIKNFETLWVNKNKKIIHVRISGAIVKDIKGNYIRFDGLVEDITKHKLAENALAKLLDFNTQLIDIAPVGIISFNKDGIINRLNKKYVEINGSNVKLLKNRLGESVFTCPILENLSLKVSIKKMLIYGKEFHIEDFPFKKYGEEFYLSAKGVPLLNINMEVEGGLLVIEDITKDVKAKKHLEYLSMHDSLTGLYNRAFFQEEMIRLSNPRFLPVTILICDLNNLKIINDTYGHFQGDKYLKDAANILKKPFRSSDTVARVGGDEFAIILPYTGKNEADRVYKRILDEIDKYNSLNPKLPMGISIGYATRLDEESMMIDIYREADNNMYKIKPGKKNDQHPEN
jgi:diguanylate cyclase (GGDEF)-like protein/PAS domain S-box-containing protein